jgi:hypothetical protein
MLRHVKVRIPDEGQPERVAEFGVPVAVALRDMSAPENSSRMSVSAPGLDTSEQADSPGVALAR